MFSNDEIIKKLSDLNAMTTNPWSLQENAIHKEFRFKDFNQAWAFMNKIAIEAEKADHHPDWCNSYNSLSISLTTHQAGYLTDKDFALAHSIERILKSYLDE